MSYEFEIPFQRRILAAAWEDQKWARANADVLRPEFFTDEILGTILAVFQDSGLPAGSIDLPVCLEELKAVVADGRQFAEYEKEARTVYKLRGTNTEHYKERAVEFGKRAALLQAVSEAHAAAEAGELDKVRPIIDRAQKVGSTGSSIYYDFFAGAGARARRYAGLDGSDGTLKIPTGLGPLDQACGGGLGAGQVGCFMGLPKHGKSTALRTVAAHAVLTGRSVLHVSLENRLDEVAQMYDARFYGRGQKVLAKVPNRFTRVMGELQAKLKSKLQIKWFPKKTLTPPMLETCIEGAGKVDVVILDYAALMRPTNPKDEKRLQLMDIYEQLGRISGECGVPIWTAHQANRPGVNAKVLYMDHMSECFEITGIVELAVSVNHDPARRAELSLYVMGSRIGESEFGVDCSVDWETSRITALSDEV